MKSFSSFHIYPGIYKKLSPSDACIFVILTVLLLVQFFIVLYEINGLFLTEIPIRHGTLNEGIADIPGNRNPLYAASPAEKDIAALMHAGLLKRDLKGGYTPHLAEHWEKQNGNEYTFRLRKNASFHDGFPVTVRDIVQTVTMTKQIEEEDTGYKDIWDDVEIHVMDDTTITFTVPEGNLGFPEGFTMPVLPEHIWKKIPEEQRHNYNGSGANVGAGPYRYDREQFTLDGQPTKLTLTEFPGHVLGRPYLKKVVLYFFRDKKELLEAYRNGHVDAIHNVPATEIPVLLKQKDNKNTVREAGTNRVFGVFFNTEEGRVLEDPFLRSILSQRTERDRIVTGIFNGKATAIAGPLPTDQETKKEDITVKELEQTLEDIGWGFEGSSGQRKKNGVPFKISFIFPNIEEMKKTADILTEEWRRLGVNVTARALPVRVMRETIGEKQFDAVLYGYGADRPEDLVDIWKSDERKNVAWTTGFESPILNNLLTELEKNTPPERLQNRLSTPSSDNWRDIVYNEIKTEMNRGAPAVFLYSPHFLYMVPGTIMGIGLANGQQSRISDPSDRFSNIHRWHLKKEKVWKFLTDNQ